MNTSNMVIVPKMSMYEWDMHRYKLTPGQILAKYERDGVDVGKVMKSHETQKQSLEELKAFFNESQFVHRNRLTRRIASNADLIIALGGDNHFQFVSHFLGSELIMGINSDPSRSEGALTYFTTHNFEETLKRLKQEEFDVEEWIRLEARLNGQLLELATSELFLGEDKRKYMSRHILEIRGRTEEQKCSGLLITTGAGSTGWYDSACRYLYEDGNAFPKTEKMARFLATEVFRGKLSQYSMLEGVLQERETLTVCSLNDDKGILSIDSLEEYPFDMGARAVIRISDKPLRIVGAMK